MRDSHWAAAQAQKSTEDRNGQEKRRQSRNFLAHQVKWTKAMLFKSARREDICKDAATSGTCHVPGPLPAAGTGTAPGILVLQEGNWNLGVHFPKQNKFNFPHASGEFFHLGMQWKKTNSLLRSLMVKAEADSKKLHEEEGEQHHAKIASCC